MWYPIKTPGLLRFLYPQLLWHKNRDKRTLYLTFDDGPIPNVTPSILKILKEHKIKATFFCVGENIHKYPEIFNQILKDGHAVGNHTYHHLKGWETPKDDYLIDIEKCQKHTKSNLFRPPYGRATRSQYSELKKFYEIVMWDIMSGDFDTSISPKKCLKNVLKHSKNGSIIVFHDNLKAESRVLYALPRAIQHWLKQGYEFEVLE
jgi:peptidoglycan/xylan/chitin deacetylase (PgdA/CDA1 family)